MPQRLRFLADGGETGALIRAYDWTTTILGPPATWPAPLKTLVGVMLSANQPMFLAWGPERTLLYNDAYAEILAAKHPSAMGQDFLEVWSEIRTDLIPIVEHAYAGTSVQMDDIALFLERHGYTEEAHFAFSYTPIRDEQGAIVGFFCPCTETTNEVLATRRQNFRLTFEDRLRDLSDPVEAITSAAEALGRYLGVGQIAYAEVKPGGLSVLIDHEWNDGTMASNAGRHQLDHYGPALIADLRQGRTVAIRDVRLDPRTSSAGALAAFARSGISSLLDVPIVKGGVLVAILAAHSATPHTWASDEITLAEDMARRTWDAVERMRAEAAMRESETRFRQIADHAPVIMWVTDPTGYTTYLNRRWYEFTGQTEHEAQGFGWLEATHPDDKAAAETAFIAANAAHQPFRIEYRLHSGGGQYRWCIDAAAPRLSETGTFLGYVGSVIDIDERREAEERQTLLSREVDHRAKNALAVVLAALRLTRAPDQASFVRAVEGRVAALARAQTLLAEDRWVGADLRTLLKGELAPFIPADGMDGQRVLLEGSAVMLPAGATQPLAMALHELATNAVKYGALSVPTGVVTLSWHLIGDQQERLCLRWAERGGPLIAHPPERRGFGSRVLQGTVRDQLGGAVSLDWVAAGLICNIEMPLRRAALSG